MYLGTNFGHGSSAALVDNNGVLQIAIEEERLNNIKNTDAYPRLTLDIIYKKYGRDLIHLEGWNIWKRFLHKGIRHSAIFLHKDTSYLKYRFYHEFKRIIQYFRYPQPIYVGHHLSHAYSLLPCGLEKNTLILVSDALSENNCITLYFWDGKNMNFISSSKYPNSIGSMFHQLAYHIGFSGRQGPGKLMALSGYGTPKWYDQLKTYTEIVNGELKIVKYPIWKMRNAWAYFAHNILDPENKEQLALKNEILNSKNNYSKAKDLACSMQKLFYQVTLTIIEQGIVLSKHKGYTVKNIGLTGGSALNCQANGKLIKTLKNKGINNFIISPWSDDGGTSVGAAYYGYCKMNPSENIKIPIAKPFLSHLPPDYSNFKLTKIDIKNIAKLIYNGNLIALCSGKMEFGPRALGGRCILAKPTIENKQKLNKIKKRPDFMPFAPVLLKEDYQTFFYDVGSEFMAWTVEAKQNTKSSIEGAIHITNEARVQIIKKNDTSLLAKILKEYKLLKNNSVLLLTSLNGKKQPISFSIEKSKETAKQLGCDFFVSDNQIIKIT